jgi:hypothetical protein
LTRGSPVEYECAIRRALRKLSPSMVVALIALGVALGGTSYAVVALAPHSVGTTQLKRNAVTSKKIKNHTVKAADLNQGEDWHNVGDPGEPAFQNGWRNVDPPTTEVVGFYRDPLGIVHLQGSAYLGFNGVIFTLPEDYRPTKTRYYTTFRSNDQARELIVCGTVVNGCGNYDPGDVVITAGPSGPSVSLDGLEYRLDE